MTTPSDPYNRTTQRPFEEDEILAPLSPASGDTASSPERSNTTAASANEAPAEDLTGLPAIDKATPQRRSIFANTDPAFDQHLPSVAESDALSQLPTTTASSPAAAAPYQPSLPSESATDVQPHRHRASLADAVGITPAVPEREISVAAAPTPVAPMLHETVARSGWEDTITPPAEELPSGRGWTHVGVLLATLFLVPFAWYLISDAGVRLALVESAPWDTGRLNLAAIGELAGGIGVLGLTWYFAKLSSLGAIVVGIIVSVFGAIPVVAPTFAHDRIITPLDHAIGSYNAFTGNVIDHLTLDMGSGRVLVLGMIVLFTGLVAHSTRRSWEKRGAIIARHELSQGN